MLSLGIELIAILILTAVLGLLMGRFLCKSGENEEREKKKKVIHAFKTSQNELEVSRDRVAEQSLILQEKQDAIANHEQDISDFTTKLLSSNKQRSQLLEELKVLEKYKSRFESLDKEFKLQSKTVEELKSEKITNQKEIADFKILTNELNKKIEHFTKGQSELEERILSLEKEHEKVLKDTNQNHQSLLKSKDKAYEELQHNTNKKYKAIVQLKDEAYETLEKNKSKAYQEMLESKTEAYNELRKEKESIEDEYEEFKINYNLDSDRLDTLEVDHEKLYHTLETIVSERDDLMARLRAISSVVGAVGIDKNENNTHPLLENS